MGFRSQLAALGACSLLLLLVNAWQRNAAQPVTSRRRVHRSQPRQPGQPGVAAQHGVVPPAAPTSAPAATAAAATAATATATLPAEPSPLEETCEGVEHLELVRSNANPNPACRARTLTLTLRLCVDPKVVRTR